MKKLRIGDTVQVIAGRAKGQRGKIVKFAKNGQYVVVEGVNLVTKFVKKGMLGKGQPGQIVKKEAPIHISNITLVCPGCGELTKVAIEVKDAKHKFRKCRRCGVLIDNVNVSSKPKKADSLNSMSAKSGVKNDKIQSDDNTKI